MASATHLDGTQLGGIVLGAQVLDEGALRRFRRPGALHVRLFCCSNRCNRQALGRQERLQQLHIGRVYVLHSVAGKDTVVACTTRLETSSCCNCQPVGHKQ